MNINLVNYNMFYKDWWRMVITLRQAVPNLLHPLIMKFQNIESKTSHYQQRENTQLMYRSKYQEVGQDSILGFNSKFLKLAQ